MTYESDESIEALFQEAALVLEEESPPLPSIAEALFNEAALIFKGELSPILSTRPQNQ